MSDTNERDRLNALRDESIKRFAEQEDKTVPSISESVVTGDGDAALESAFDAVRKLHVEGKASIIFFGVLSPLSVDEDNSQGTNGLLEVIAKTLTPLDLLTFMQGNLPARVADHVASVLHRTLESQILNLTVKADEEKGN